MLKSRRRIALVVLASVAMVLAGWALYRAQGRAVHFGVAGSPGVRATRVEIDTGGLRLPGLVFRSRGGGSALQPGVVLLHGTNRAGAEPVLYRALAAELARHGAVALLYDQRGYGAAPDPPRDAAGRYDLAFVEDALRAVDFLAGYAGVDPARVRLAGHSFGGSVAVGVAHRAGIERRLEAVVVISPGRGVNDRDHDRFAYRQERLSADMELAPPLERSEAVALYADLEVETLVTSPPRVPVILVNNGQEELQPAKALAPIHAAMTSPAVFAVVPGVGHGYGSRHGESAHPPWAETYRREPLGRLARIILQTK